MEPKAGDWEVSRFEFRFLSSPIRYVFCLRHKAWIIASCEIGLAVQDFCCRLCSESCICHVCTFWCLEISIFFCSCCAKNGNICAYLCMYWQASAQLPLAPCLLDKLPSCPSHIDQEPQKCSKSSDKAADKQSQVCIGRVLARPALSRMRQFIVYKLAGVLVG